jgi:putative ABC transport system substrate-binding protein
MKRREFITVLGVTLASWPLAARAQQPERIRSIGVLMGTPEGDPEGQARVAAFRQALQELKWTEGNNIHIDIFWATGNAARASAYAAELVKLAPDVILGIATPTMRALKQATQTIPIVFAGLSDPIGDGIVANLSRPGGNITGFSSFDAPIAGKWLQMLKEMSPGIARINVIFNPDTAPHSIFWPALEAAAPSVGVTLIRATVRDTAAIEGAIGALAADPGNGLIVAPDIFTSAHRALVITLAARHRVPAVYPIRYFAVDGGLMSYGSDFVDLHRRAAFYIDRILKGEKPGDLPVQTPTKLEFVINLKTAKALGLTVPAALLASADAVIE